MLKERSYDEHSTSILLFIVSHSFCSVLFLCPSQSKKYYELRCKEADEAEQMAEKMGSLPTATPKQIDKVNP